MIVSIGIFADAYRRETRFGSQPGIPDGRGSNARAGSTKRSGAGCALLVARHPFDDRPPNRSPSVTASPPAHTGVVLFWPGPASIDYRGGRGLAQSRRTDLESQAAVRRADPLWNGIIHPGRFVTRRRGNAKKSLMQNARQRLPFDPLRAHYMIGIGQDEPGL